MGGWGSINGTIRGKVSVCGVSTISQKQQKLSVVEKKFVSIFHNEVRQSIQKTYYQIIVENTLSMLYFFKSIRNLSEFMSMKTGDIIKNII